MVNDLKARMNAFAIF